jgi:ribonuclease D
LGATALSPAQVTYAISDVTHLRDVYLKLAGVSKTEPYEQVSEEMKILTSANT